MNDEQGEAFQLTCPICKGQTFETIRIYRRFHDWRWDRQAMPADLQERMAWALHLRRITSYRCLTCDYILMFAKGGK